MFEVGGTYANRKGKYTILSLNGPKMRVRFDDGSTADLNVDIQHRIWENIQVEEDAKQAARAARASLRGRAYSQSTQFFIKPISMLAAEELTFPGWQERVAATGDETKEIKAGDRLIYYAIEPQVFFAVATVTGVSFEAGGKDSQQVSFYPIDLDAHAHNLEKAVALDSVELESQPNLKELLKQPDTYFKISEDDFELLAELLTEVTEEEEEDEEEEEEEEEDEE
jgi:hypothetical protein